jgi:hypothetical protein
VKSRSQKYWWVVTIKDRLRQRNFLGSDHPEDKDGDRIILRQVLGKY